MTLDQKPQTVIHGKKTARGFFSRAPDTAGHEPRRAGTSGNERERAATGGQRVYQTLLIIENPISASTVLGKILLGPRACQPGGGPVDQLARGWTGGPAGQGVDWWTGLGLEVAPTRKFLHPRALV